VLPDQVRVYRAVADLFERVGGSAEFAQVIVAQQMLVQSVEGYLRSLEHQWLAAVDLAELLQVDHLAELNQFSGPSVSVPAP
jgi:hypothetical protein